MNLLEKITKVLNDKKAIDVISIPIAEKSTLADYFVIATGTSSTHIKALADEVEETLKKDHILPHKIEGRDSNSWILMDYGDIVVNIFTQENRLHYNLEEL